MSDTVEKLLNADPEKFKQSQEEHEKLKQMALEEFEQQASIAGKNLGIDQCLLREIKRAKALQKSYGINTARKSPDPSPELPMAIHHESVSSTNLKAVVDLLGQNLDVQEKLLEGAERDRRAAAEDRRIAEQRYIQSVKSEKRSFKVGVASAAFAGIAALASFIRFDALAFTIPEVFFLLLKLCLLLCSWLLLP